MSKHVATVQLIYKQSMGPPLCVVLDKRELAQLSERIVRTNNLFHRVGFKVESAKPIFVRPDTERQCAAITLTLVLQETTTMTDAVTWVATMLGYTAFEDIYGLIKTDEDHYAMYYNVAPSEWK